MHHEAPLDRPAVQVAQRRRQLERAVYRLLGGELPVLLPASAFGVLCHVDRFVCARFRGTCVWTVVQRLGTTSNLGWRSAISQWSANGQRRGDAQPVGSHGIHAFQLRVPG